MNVQAFQVNARLGGTQGKKAQKTIKKTASKVAGGAKKTQKQAKSTVKQSKNKAVTKSGAGNWYGPDRPKFLGTNSENTSACRLTLCCFVDQTECMISL